MAARTMLVNHVREAVKPVGHKIPRLAEVLCAPRTLKCPVLSTSRQGCRQNVGGAAQPSSESVRRVCAPQSGKGETGLGPERNKYRKR